MRDGRKLGLADRQSVHVTRDKTFGRQCYVKIIGGMEVKYVSYQKTSISRIEAGQVLVGGVL